MKGRRVGQAMERCAEVVVRIADSTVAVAHVLGGHSYRVGRARDVQLPLDVDAFDLVASTPHGFEIRRGPDAAPEPLDDLVAIRFGHIEIEITATRLRRVRLARRRLERRPYGFGSASIAAHLAILLIAFWVADPEETSVAGVVNASHKPTRVARFAVESQTTKREDKPAPADLPITTDDTPSENPSVDPPAPAKGPEAPALEPPNGHGRIVEPTAASSPSDGSDSPSGEHHFDPDANPAFDSVKVGKFATVSSGKAGGEQFQLAGANGDRKPLIVISCDAQTCLILGGDPASPVREELERRLPEIIACYQDHESSAGKKVELDFGINDHGKVNGVNVGGVGDYDSCVSNIINNLKFGADEPSGSAT